MAVYVMTGGSSGLGQVAAERIAREHRLLMAARHPKAGLGEQFQVDLLNLSDIRRFVEDIKRALQGSGIDVLVLNAGGQGGGRTSEGYDGIFVVNYLSHYLLVRQLLSRMNPGGRILLTTSGTHDPAEKTIIPPPLHANAKWLAQPSLDPNREKDTEREAMGRAYASAKLCVVLLARALAKHPFIREKNVSVCAYDPGPTPGTGLTRGAGSVAEFVWRWLAFPLRFFFRGANTVEQAGNALAELALGREGFPSGEIYAVLRGGRLGWRRPSELAQQDDLRDALWADSAELVGLEVD